MNRWNPNIYGRPGNTAGAGHFFVLWFLLSIYLLSIPFPRLFSAVSDWMSTIAYFHTWCGLGVLARIDNSKNLLNSNVSLTCPHNTLNFSPLAAEISWRVWGTPAHFNGFHVLTSVTAQHSSSGHQPDFAALNRGRHLCSTGRPSHWALAHILVNLCSLLSRQDIQEMLNKLKMWANMPNVMAALPNTGSALCSTPQSLADAHY